MGTAEEHLDDLKKWRGEQIQKIEDKKKVLLRKSRRPGFSKIKRLDYETYISDLESFLEYLNEEIEYYEKN